MRLASASSSLLFLLALLPAPGSSWHLALLLAACCAGLAALALSPAPRPSVGCAVPGPAELAASSTSRHAAASILEHVRAHLPPDYVRGERVSLLICDRSRIRALPLALPELQRLWRASTSEVAAGVWVTLEDPSLVDPRGRTHCLPALT